MKNRKSLLLLFLALIVTWLVAAPPSQASKLPPMEYPPRMLKPVSETFINGLSDFGNIQVVKTFQCGTMYQADWNLDKGAIWVKLTGAAFAFHGNDGRLHIHAFTADPPSAIHGMTPGIRYANLPDYSLQNSDGTIPVEVWQYRHLYRRWQTRPCIDITESLLPHRKYSKGWQYLVERNQTAAVRYLLGEMGLDPDTGLPYQEATPLAYSNFETALTDGVEFKPYEQPLTNITNEGAEYEDGTPPTPFCFNCLTDDEIVSQSTGSGGFSQSVGTAAAVLTLVGAVLVFLSRMRRGQGEGERERERVR